MGHGSATGVEAADLQAVARTLARAGVTVALMTQPYRVERNRSAADQASLDIAWASTWSRVSREGVPVIAGGRSAGAQVACRTAGALGAIGVVALAYPIRGPGSRSELLRTAAPTLIVQGGADPFGTPAEYPRLPPRFELVEVPGADHMFDGGAGGLEGNVTRVTSAVRSWVDRLLFEDSP
ncbi:alpha/beta family hydrolase [Angustibacter sp. McL0619]|uniref:alpha/beta hydrolase family protein n=1 Tax=Angustibacter sp. McL0619 TaxID=3415676 RepID=UPI003CF2E3B4